MNTDKLAWLFLQLAQLEKAGLPADKAFGLIAESDKNLEKQLYSVEKQLRLGKSIAEAGFKVGIFNDIQRAVIDAGETSGTLASIYKRLADYYAMRAKRLRKIKSRCYYPAALIVLSLFLTPLPELIAGTMSLFQYLYLSVGRLAGLAIVIYLLVTLPTLLHQFGLKPVFDRLQWQLPWVSDWVIKRQLNDFYLNLSLLLSAGLSFKQALPKLVTSIPNANLRAQFSTALTLAASGKSVSEILMTVDCIRGSTVLQVINSCEQSGTLAEGLQHFSTREADNLSLQDDMLAEWLPRLVYCAVAISIARSVIVFYSTIRG